MKINNEKDLSVYFQIHHLIPKHASYWSDLHEWRENPLYKIPLTIEGHSCQHDILHRVWGCWQDKYAAAGLAGLIGKEELLREISKNNPRFDGKKHREETKQQMSESAKLSDYSPTFETCSKGGKIGGAKTRDSGKLRKASVLGGKARKGIKWYHQIIDGKIIRKMSMTPLDEPWIAGKGKNLTNLVL